MPICYRSSDFLALYGWGDLERTNQVLKEFGLHAVPVNGKAIWQIATMDYRESTIGPYRELVISVLASKQQSDAFWNMSTDYRLFQMSNLNLFSPTEEFGSFVIKLWVDTKAALFAGREVWGLTKDYAKIGVRTPELLGGPMGFDMEIGSEKTLSTSWMNRPHEGVPFNPNLEYYVISPAGNWAVTAIQGTAKQAAFPRDLDLFMLDARNPWGQLLQYVSFAPFQKAAIQNATMQLYGPTAK